MGDAWMRYNLVQMYRTPSNYRDTDLMRAAEERGWILARVAGSHHVYRKPGWPIILSINGGVRADGTKRAIVRVLQDEEASEH
jgi:predicted RNA binding protein YcfA (HicA-like mRNA interferase family)